MTNTETIRLGNAETIPLDKLRMSIFIDLRKRGLLKESDDTNKVVLETDRQNGQQHITAKIGLCQLGRYRVTANGCVLKLGFVR